MVAAPIKIQGFGARKKTPATQMTMKTAKDIRRITAVSNNANMIRAIMMRVVK